MKKLLYSLIIMIAAICACQDENSDLGQSLVNSSFYNVYVDTCTVDISTILMDSIETRGDSICQLGHYKDASWGEVSAAYYAEYSKNSFTPNEDYSYSFDSLVLRMTPSGNFWGDTLTQQRISVYRLKQAIYLDDDDKFKEKFPGLALMAENSGECITGFMVNDSSMAITLHYKEIASQRTEKELIFSVNTDYAYTSIRHDRTSTPLATLESGIENLIHSGSLGRRAYMQGLTGFYNQIEFPHLNNLQDAGEIVSIESATLYLYPLTGSYNKLNQLPEDIRLYITDENNVLEDYVYGSDGVTVQTGNLTVDDMFGRDTYYSFDVTEFIRNNFGTWGIKRQKLLLSLPENEMTMTFNQIIFTNDPDQERQCRLEIRFKIYNEK